VDYEYGCASYRGFDIANHFCEYAGFDCDWSKYPSKQVQIEWFKKYLGDYTDEDLEVLYKEVEFFELTAHFFWGVWALVFYY
jgi:ethanolamine kinase